VEAAVCELRPLEGFVNVDLLEAPGVDVVADVSGRLPFDDGSVDLLYASHVLEHLPTARVSEVLREWRRVLRDGGRILIAVPDLERIAHLLVSRSGWFTPPNQPWVGLVYGGQKDGLDFHKTGFSSPWLAALLHDAGFGSTERVERFPEIGANDASWSPLPFGTNISLNMRAVLGAVDVLTLAPDRPAAAAYALLEAAVAGARQGLVRSRLAVAGATPRLRECGARPARTERRQDSESLRQGPRTSSGRPRRSQSGRAGADAPAAAVKMSTLTMPASAAAPQTIRPTGSELCLRAALRARADGSTGGGARVGRRLGRRDARAAAAVRRPPPAGAAPRGRTGQDPGGDGTG
jgi:SAM-dependent methyltransferase